MKNEEKTCCGGGCESGACGENEQSSCGEGGCGTGSCSEESKSCSDDESGSCGEGQYSSFHKKPICLALFCLLLLSITALLGFKARNAAREYKFIGVPLERNTITVSGEGKVVGIPDVATVDLGMTVERLNVADAQKENTRVMNDLLKFLKEQGIASKDVQTTNYTIQPRYDWANGKQTLRGYIVAQNVHVKIRKLEIAGDVLGKAGELGANQIGGISFIIDDPEGLKQQARIKAFENVKEKAGDLAQAAGVKLRRVISFGESQGGNPSPMYYEKAYAGVSAMAAPAPMVEPGSTEVVVNANITYEIE